MPVPAFSVAEAFDLPVPIEGRQEHYDRLHRLLWCGAEAIDTGVTV